MSTTAEQARAYRGPAVLSFGFRPFFLAGAAWAALAIALWLPMLVGRLTLPTAFAPLEWHVHELLYGYVPAVVAGFLLTAVPNWTGRLAVVGTRLLALFLVWLAGRLAILFSQALGPGLSAAIDLAFLAVLGAVIAREIIAGNDKRNLKVLIMVALLFTGNAVFHLEAGLKGSPHFGIRIGIAATVLLIMLMGGRIIPSFTRNWLAKRGPGRLPVPFGRFDIVAMAMSGAALAAWIAAPVNRVTAGLAVVAAVLNVLRLARWAGDRTGAEPLVTVLHAGFAFIPLGFALVALGILRPDVVTATGAVHAWSAGAIGLMTLAVMTRASLGHTGRPLTATPAIQVIYLAAGISAITRIAAAFDLLREPMLHVSATMWVVAFASFVIVFAPLLLRRRR
jgi:uncharacterized protein involved in response to NO